MANRTHRGENAGYEKRFAYASLTHFVNYSPSCKGYPTEKKFPYVAMTASGVALGYFKNSHDAGRYLEEVVRNERHGVVLA